MIPPKENELKPVEAGSSNRQNLIPLNPKTDFSDDLDVRADGSFDIEKFLDSKIDSTNL
jgi:hypothetical protein